LCRLLEKKIIIIIANIIVSAFSFFIFLSLDIQLELLHKKALE